MKLVFIYGPPAVGKLTVAKELCKLTGFKIFHNHLTVDLVESVLEFGTKDFFDLCSKFRLELFESAAKMKIKGLIFTFCYSKGDDDSFVNQVVNAIEKFGGEVCFVQLVCSKKDLGKRVVGVSRRKSNKIKTIKELDKTLKGADFFSPVPFKDSLKIDNTKMKPMEAAKKIKSTYSL